MIHADARRLAESHLKAREKATGHELAIDDEETISFEYGWLFFYNTAAFLSSRDDMDRLVGNAPIFVDKETAGLRLTDTGYPPQDYIAEIIREKRGGSG